MSAQSNSAEGPFVSAACALRRAGFAIHWLRERSKAPVADGWSRAPVASEEVLRASFRDGFNLGVRLGEPSQVASAYLHCLDVDVRVPELADEAFARLRELFEGVDIDTFPSVISGSGGASRHIYFVTSRPFYSRKLAVSGDKIQRLDKARGKWVWSHSYEIELLGTGKQVVLPPSIHPDTGKPYVWERPFDLDALELGAAPTIPAERLAGIVDPVDETYDFEAVEPLTFKAGQLEAELDELSDDRIDEYHDWVTLGQALHHQYGGSREGYDLWVRHSKRSEKFDEREMPGKWRSFGRSRRRPVTMASVRQWVLEARRQSFVDSFDDAFEDLPDTAEGGGREIASNDPLDDEISGLLGGGGRDPFDDDVDPLDAPVELPWQSLLDFNPDTQAIRPNLHNLRLILENDERFVGLAQTNLFTHEIVQRTAPGVKPQRRKNEAKPTVQLDERMWKIEDAVNGDLWSDDRDFALRSIIETPKTRGGYGVKVSDRDLKAGITLAADKFAFHPIREYLEGLTWDGVARVERLWIDYLGAPDDPYHREIARLMLIAGVTRIYEPGHKFDFATILESIQGKRKSTFIEVLGRSWFAELTGNFSDHKQMVELMQGAWIMEIPELSGFGRSDVRDIKAFISRRKDRVRLAYARRAGEYPRQVIFIGSTNDSKYLKDDSGGRRFWPVACREEAIDLERLEKHIDLIWAEAFVLYREMRRQKPRGTLPLYLQGRALEIALEKQQTRTHESQEMTWAGEIAAWLEKPMQTGDLMDDTTSTIMRNVTCLKQIWEECLGRPGGTYTTPMAHAVGRALDAVPGWAEQGMTKIGKYGRQRTYRRVFG